MKYIKYTYVDAATKKPVSEEPARRGPMHLEGVTPTFALEETFSSGVPTFYGVAEDSYQLPLWVEQSDVYGEADQEEFFSQLKQELNRRSRVKRKAVEEGGIYVGGTYVNSSIESQNRIANMVAFLDSSPETLEINYQVQPGEWVVISRNQAKVIGVALGQHVQECFNWCKSINDQVAAIETLEDAGVVSHVIATWGGTPFSQQPEEEE